ncbi:MAG TPA: phosphotransferase family protein [Acidimicrobiales bacterium]|nr:phosphotransferase family protein [Acidimicrobiales bacterium]
MTGDAGVVPAEVAPVRPGEELDWDALVCYLRDQLPELAGEFRVLQFPNGSANLTYLVQFGDQGLVVRRPPFGHLAPGAHDMRREYRTLSALWRQFDKAPRAFLFCDDHSVVGSDFLVIEYRSGDVIWGTIPPSMQSHRDVGRRVGLAVVDALAELHLVEPAAAGLGDLGRPDGFVERQVAGWKKRWSLAAPFGTEPLMDVIGHRLERAMPRSPRASILHNDYKLDNCQFDAADPDRVKSIFDWDMASLGDPFVDLGTLLNYWPDPSDTEDNRPIYNPGMESLGLPTRAEVIDRYARGTDLDVGDVHWYEAFACWKTAVILQQLYTRYLRGESTDERMATRGDRIAGQARRAMMILDDAGL